MVREYFVYQNNEKVEMGAMFSKKKAISQARALHFKERKTTVTVQTRKGKVVFEKPAELYFSTFTKNLGMEEHFNLQLFDPWIASECRNLGIGFIFSIADGELSTGEKERIRMVWNCDMAWV